MRSSLSSAGVSKRTLMGYPSYASNGACTLHSSSAFHYVMAEIVLAVQLVTHAKSSIWYGCPYGNKSNFFRLDGLLLFRIITGLRCARCEHRYERVGRLKTREDLCHKKRRERELLQMKNILNRWLRYYIFRQSITYTSRRNWVSANKCHTKNESITDWSK